MKKIAFIGLLLFTSVLFSQEKISKNLGDFSVLKVYNGIALILIKSDSQKMEITGKESKNVKVKNVNGTLKISLSFPKIMADNKLMIKLYFNKNIKVIDANEGATITGNSIKQTQLEVRAQEGAFVNLKVETGHLKVKGSSGGVLKLSGTAKTQRVDVDLGSTYHGYDLDAMLKSVIRSGSGAKAEVKAAGLLDLKVSFGGSIFYRGNPKTLKSKSIVGGIIEKR